MFHPLLEDPSKLKDQDLDSKILDLGKKYFIASRMGQGGVANQLLMALDAFKYEQHRRQYESTQNLVKKQNKGLDELINID